MTAADYYATHSDFRDAIDIWIEHRRCPMYLVDICIELGEDAMADCCRWAATEPERPVFGTKRTKLSPPYPSNALWSLGAVYWIVSDSDYATDDVNYADVVPLRSLNISSGDTKSGFTSVCDAILWLLDNWKPAPVEVPS